MKIHKVLISENAIHDLSSIAEYAINIEKHGM
jgi:hypothetical protein